MAPKLNIDSTLEDLAHGQIVLVTARWILVATALFLILWNPEPIAQLRIQVAVLLLLAFGNFYLNLELFKRRRTLKTVVYGASAADLAIITLFVMLQGGYGSEAFAFYFPALLGLSVAFPTVLTFLYAGGAISLYGFICFASLVGRAVTDDSTLGTAELQTLVARLLMLTAVAFCGHLYRRIENERRRAAEQAQAELMARLRERSALPS
jgi:hypothetical protein